ncbi:MAG: hypothetical protein Q4F63_04480, partial [Clostridia bacterium]|nr:hypothetical protein [Clostridia bacterium]
KIYLTAVGWLSALAESAEIAPKEVIRTHAVRLSALAESADNHFLQACRFYRHAEERTGLSLILS